MGRLAGWSVGALGLAISLLAPTGVGVWLLPLSLAVLASMAVTHATEPKGLEYVPAAALAGLGVVPLVVGAIWLAQDGVTAGHVAQVVWGVAATSLAIVFYRGAADLGR